MAKQEALPLDAGLQALYGTAGQKMLAIIQKVIRESEAKQGDDFAPRLGIKGPHLSDALNSNGKHFSVLWLPAVLHADKRHQFIEYAAGLVNQRICPKAPLPPAQKLDLLLSELRRAGADTEAIEARAYAHAEADEVSP